jgi:hypothetical protein
LSIIRFVPSLTEEWRNTCQETSTLPLFEANRKVPATVLEEPRNDLKENRWLLWKDYEAAGIVSVGCSISVG